MEKQVLIQLIGEKKNKEIRDKIKIVLKKRVFTDSNDTYELQPLTKEELFNKIKEISKYDGDLNAFFPRISNNGEFKENLIITDAMDIFTKIYEVYPMLDSELDSKLDSELDSKLDSELDSELNSE